MVACWLSLVLAARLEGSDYIQVQGKVMLRLRDVKKENGRVEIRLSGVQLTIAVHGNQPRVQLNEAIVKSKGWKVKPVAAAQAVNEKSVWQRHFQLLPPVKPGEALELELHPLVFSEAKGLKQTVTWKPVRLHIIKPLLADMRGPTSPEPAPPARSWRPLVGGILTGLVLLAFFFLVWRLIRRRWHRATELTPAALALHELERLTALDLTTNGEVEHFPTLLSDVLRRYLEARFRLQAPRQTTTEFLASMEQATQLAPSQQLMLRDFLQRCDLAKFARALPSTDECRQLAEQVRQFVVQTSEPS
jgi:hypothetical protein